MDKYVICSIGIILIIFIQQIIIFRRLIKINGCAKWNIACGEAEDMKVQNKISELEKTASEIGITEFTKPIK